MSSLQEMHTHTHQLTVRGEPETLFRLHEKKCSRKLVLCCFDFHPPEDSIDDISMPIIFRGNNTEEDNKCQRK